MGKKPWKGNNTYYEESGAYFPLLLLLFFGDKFYDKIAYQSSKVSS